MIFHFPSSYQLLTQIYSKRVCQIPKGPAKLILSVFFSSLSFRTTQWFAVLAELSSMLATAPWVSGAISRPPRSNHRRPLPRGRDFAQ